MTYKAYATVQYYHGKTLDGNGNPCSGSAKIYMIAGNLFIRQIYVAHPMVVIIRNSWNSDMSLTLFSTYFVHLGLVLLVHYWPAPKKSYTSITLWTVVTKNQSTFSIHLRSKVPNESTLQNISLRFICLSSIFLTFLPGYQ